MQPCSVQYIQGLYSLVALHYFVMLSNILDISLNQEVKNMADTVSQFLAMAMAMCGTKIGKCKMY